MSWITLAIGQGSIDYLAPPIVLSLEDHREDSKGQGFEETPNRAFLKTSYQPNSRRKFLSTVWKRIIGTLVTGSVINLAGDHDSTERQCLEEKEKLEQELSRLDQKHGLYSHKYIWNDVDRVLQIDDYFQSIKSYLGHSKTNPYRFLIVLDVLGLITHVNYIN